MKSLILLAIIGWVGVPLESGTPQAVIPDVVGEVDFATADAALEMVNLDGLEVEECSLAPNNEVTRQSPAAGLTVDEGTIVTVYTSTGVECIPLLRPRISIGRGL